MANNTCKCKYCGSEIDKNTAYNPSPRMYYCSKEHFDERERKRLGENNKSNKIKYKPQENTNRREFTDYVQNIYVNRYGWNKNKINWTIICSNASNILKQHENWTYDTLTYILYYMNEILELDLICQESNYNPLSLLPFYAQEAEDYFNEMSAIDDIVSTFDNTNNEKIIEKNKSKIKYKQIDMGCLL